MIYQNQHLNFCLDKSFSLYPSWNNIVEVLKWRAVNQPFKTAFCYINHQNSKKNTISYYHLHQRVVSLAKHLIQSNCYQKPVFLLFPSGIDFIISFFACLYAGAIAVPLSSSKQLKNIIRIDTIAVQCFPETILTTQSVLNAISPSLDRVNLKSDIKNSNWCCVDNAEIVIEDIKLPQIKPEALAFIQYTSGSTSDPKGVCVSHLNIMSNEKMIADIFNHDYSTIFCGWLPLFHDMGLIGNVLQPIYLGIVSYLFSPTAFIQDPFFWLQTITNTKATTSGAPNFAYDLCVKTISKDQKKTLDLSSWKVAFNGAEPILPETMKSFSTAFECCGFNKNAFLPCYGMAEATLIVSGHQKQRYFSINKDVFTKSNIIEPSDSVNNCLKMVSCGPCANGSKVLAYCEKNKCILPPNQVGEIIIAGPHITSGYWNKNNKCSSLFLKFKQYPDLFFLRSGDLGFISTDNEVVITGRKKELIVLRGKNIYPYDYEKIIEDQFSWIQNHGVAMAQLPESHQNDILLVCEIKRSYRKKLNLNDLNALELFLSKQLSGINFSICFLQPASLPKTPSGKKQRVLILNQFLNNELNYLHINSFKVDNKTSNITQMIPKLKSNDQQELETLLISILQPYCHQQACEAKDNLISLGLNSIDLLQIQYAIEQQLFVQLSYDDIVSTQSIRELTLCIDNKQKALCAELNCV